MYNDKIIQCRQSPAHCLRLHFELQVLAMTHQDSELFLLLKAAYLHQDNQRTQLNRGIPFESHQDLEGSVDYLSRPHQILVILENARKKDLFCQALQRLFVLPAQFPLT